MIPSPPDSAPAAPNPGLSIVVADDARDLQALLTLWLREAGHHVQTASSGHELVRLLQERAYDIVITDILMPDGDGWDAIAEVQRLRPQTRILAISGGAREMPASAVLRVAQGAGAIAVLKKPFTRVDLLISVGRVMGRAARIA